MAHENNGPGPDVPGEGPPQDKQHSTPNGWRFSTFKNVKDVTPKAREVFSAKDLYRFLEDAMSAHDGDPEEAKQRLIPLWSPATYHEGMTAGSDGVEEVYAFLLDFDDGMSPEFFEQEWEALTRIEHSTIRHSPHRARWRVIFLLARPVPAKDWPKVYRKLALRFGGGLADEARKDVGRRYFLPAFQPVHEAAADVLGMSTPALKSRLYRGRTALRDKLGALAP
ncbi:MAG: hypothetical protein ACR2HJ_12765 [Fimbriimonadales bacterium]